MPSSREVQLVSNSKSQDAGFVCVARLSDCVPGIPFYAHVQDRQLILVRDPHSECVHCVGAICPHEGASLAGGEVRDGELSCPQHHLRFDLRTGACRQTPRLGLSRYATRIERGNVLVCLEPIAYVPPPPGE